MLLTRDLAIYDARYHLHGDLRIKGTGEKGSTIYNTSQAEYIILLTRTDRINALHSGMISIALLHTVYRR